jgi:hypothetical protein
LLCRDLGRIGSDGKEFGPGLGFRQRRYTFVALLNADNSATSSPGFVLTKLRSSMSLADELLADLDDVGDEEETTQGTIHDQGQTAGMGDSDTEMANGEEEVGGGLVLEGAFPSRRHGV